MQPFEIRNARPADSTSLAILADIATRRLTSYLWGSNAAAGQSPFEVGRQIIRTNRDSALHHKHWHVAEEHGAVLAAMNGYILSDVTFGHPLPKTADVLSPLNTLKRAASGSWYISVLAVFEEARGRQIGQRLLSNAECFAIAASATETSLMVGSFNAGAYRLYQRMGYHLRDEREFVPFPGSDANGRWQLMTKPVRAEV